nr:GtrA family protein [Endozoicomonas sp. SESOKO4]
MRPIKFIVTGAAAAAVHLWVLWLLVDLTQLAPLLANPAAFILAFVVSYLGIHCGLLITSSMFIAMLW